MRHLRRLALVLLALAAAGCPKRAQLPPVSQDAQQAIDHAVGDMEAKRYSKAEDQFTFIIFNFPGSHEASDAQYYLAETYFRDKDYIEAQNEFGFYLKSYPNGRFQEDATYKLAVSYLRSAPGPIRDQTRTLKARETVDQFLETYPDSPLRSQIEQLRGDIGERLALREFDAARLYYTSGEFKSALVYYNHVNDSFPAERWPGVERYRFAVCLLETGDTAKARTVLSELVTGDYPASIQQKARSRAGRIPIGLPLPGPPLPRLPDNNTVVQLPTPSLRVQAPAECDSYEFRVYRDGNQIARARTDRDSCQLRDSLEAKPGYEWDSRAHNRAGWGPYFSPRWSFEVSLHRDTLAPVFFETDSSGIRAEDVSVLDSNAAVLQRHPEWLVRVTGHCDPRGSEAYNNVLGLKRAQAAADRLLKAGVAPTQITVQSAGETSRVSANPDEYWKDRRVEFVLK